MAKKPVEVIQTAPPPVRITTGHVRLPIIERHVYILGAGETTPSRLVVMGECGAFVHGIISNKKMLRHNGGLLRMREEIVSAVTGDEYEKRYSWRLVRANSIEEALAVLRWIEGRAMSGKRPALRVNKRASAEVFPHCQRMYLAREVLVCGKPVISVSPGGQLGECIICGEKPLVFCPVQPYEEEIP